MALPTYGASGTYTSATTASAAVPVPAGVAANSLIIVSLYKENNAAITPPAGFTAFNDSPMNTSPSISQHAIFWKRATGADSGTYTFTWTGSIAAQYFASRYEGVITTGDPYDFSDLNQNSSTSTTTPAVSGTTVGADRLLVWVGVSRTTAATTPPATFTERVDTSAKIGMATKDFPTAGASGSITGTKAFTGVTLASLVALKSPDPAPSDPVIHARYSYIPALRQSTDW